MLEGYFKALFAETHRYTRMGAWWDRKGENEIDLVCENELKGTLDFYEVKRSATRFNPAVLALKVEAFLKKNPNKRAQGGRKVGLSMSDM